MLDEEGTRQPRAAAARSLAREHEGLLFRYCDGPLAGLIEDYFRAGKRWKFRFMEKGGKYNEVPAPPQRGSLH